MSQDENKIVDFWENKDYYKETNVLLEKARIFYTDDFINNYEKWSANLKDLNNAIRVHLESKHFPMRFWSEMTYDWFCKNINKLIQEWITVNNDIVLQDIPIITEKMIADYIAICIKNAHDNEYTIASLVDSIKRTVVL